MSHIPTFHQSSPILVVQVAREIKAICGVNPWDLKKFDFAFMVRFEIGSKQFRVAIPPINGDPVSLPEEKTPTHTISSIPALREWLSSQASLNNS